MSSRAPTFPEVVQLYHSSVVDALTEAFPGARLTLGLPKRIEAWSALEAAESGFELRLADCHRCAFVALNSFRLALVSPVNETRTWITRAQDLLGPELERRDWLREPMSKIADFPLSESGPFIGVPIRIEAQPVRVVWALVGRVA